MYKLIFTLALQMSLLSPLPERERINAKLDPGLLARTDLIDIVYVSGIFSHVEYRGSRNAQNLPPAFPSYSVAPRLIPFGKCTRKNGTLYRHGSRHCGYLVPLAESGEAINLLGYDELVLTGQFSGAWEVAFADTPLAMVEDNVPVGRIEASGTSRFPLTPVFRNADLSRGRQLVLLLTSPSGSVMLEQVMFRYVASGSPQKTGRGVWIWNRNQVLGQEEKVLDRLATLSVGRVYLQVGDDPHVFAPFLRRAVQRGIEVYALDGSPDYVASPDALLARIQAVENYNRAHPEAPFAGFQTDIEPYLNKDFNARKEYYATAYADLVSAIKRRFTLPLSVVVPFWFDTVHAGSRTLIQRIVEAADEVVVMSYRTDAGAVLEISRSTLSLGERFKKPVWLGIELGAIPDEHHVVLEKSASSAPDAVKLGELWWKRRTEYRVKGSAISFKSGMEALPVFMETPIPFGSFRGWVLHSYEELP